MWHYDESAPNATQLARLERQVHNASRGRWSQSIQCRRGSEETKRAARMKSRLGGGPGLLRSYFQKLFVD